MSHHEHPLHSTHVASFGQYLAIFIALLVLTALTVAVSRVDFGSMNIVVAMGIAVVKAALVVLFFMHLYWSAPINKLAFATALVFLAILFSFTLSDYVGRTWTAVAGK